MNIWAIVPAKPVDSAKTRLRLVLSAEQRAALVESMFQHTLDTLVKMDELAGVLVVSADPQIWQCARRYGARVLEEPDVPGLNTSIERGVQALDAEEVDAVLIVHADLPYLTQKSLLPLIAQAHEPPVAAIIPDQARQGTNVMLLSPPGLIPFRYGEGSFQKHRAEVEHVQARFVEITPSPLSTDIDMPEDLTGEILAGIDPILKKTTHSDRTEKPERLSRKVIYENPWVNLYADRVRFPDGRIIEEYHLLDFEMEAVSVLVENDQGQVLMIQSYRYPTGTLEWELPAGVVDEGETILETAQREALEETGYSVSMPEPVYTYYPFIGMANKVYHITRCRALEKVADFDHNEVRAVRWVSREEAREMIREGIVRDGFTLTALLMFGV